MKKIFLVALITIYYLLFTIIAPSAHAQGISLGIYPPIFQINATPPAQVQSPLSIENRGDDPINLKIELRPFVASDQEDGLIKYVTQDEANFADPLLFQRVRVFDGLTPVDSISLSPKQQKNLTLAIDIPKDSPTSDYYFSVIFVTAPSDSSQVNSSQSLSGIATNVLLSVGATSQSTGLVQEFSSPLFLDKGPVPFTVRVKNTSNHFITPHGDILVKNIFGQTVGKANLVETNILAGTVRNVPSKDFLDENQNLPSEVAAYWPEKFLLGPYKASLTLAISDQGPIFSRDVYFFALPFKAIVGIIVILLISAYVFIRVKKRL